MVLTQQKCFVSSAKHVVAESLTASGGSFTYRRNRVEPSMLPCGTPEATGFSDQVAPSVVTCKLCVVVKE